MSILRKAFSHALARIGLGFGPGLRFGPGLGFGLGAGLALTVFGAVSAGAQQMPRGPEQLMRPQYDRGQPVSPIFEGWYRNPDGTISLSFGFFNRNAEEDLEIPLGPDNFIEPAQYDGQQPTSFPSERRAGYIGRGWGVFTVVVPGDFPPNQDVVWTLRSKGRTYSVPGRITRQEYRLSDVDQPAGVGSMPPRLRFEANGPEGIGPAGIRSSRTFSGRVGAPITISVWAADNYDSEMRDPVPVTLIWSKHQGPPEGRVTFGPDSNNLRAPAEGGEVSTTATFSAPGRYVLRVEAGNFASRDSSNPDHCCWTNGYVTVDVQ
jgi:hypothetical protein